MMHIIEELYVIPHKQLLHEGPTFQEAGSIEHEHNVY